MKKHKFNNWRNRFLVFAMTFLIVGLVSTFKISNLTFKVLGAENTASQVKTDWTLIDGKWFYYDVNGTLITGWLYDGGKWYFLNKDGSMATGWIKDGGKWYYLYSNGSMAANTEINGFTLGADGAWSNGFDISEVFNSRKYITDQKTLLKNKVNQIILDVIKPNMSDFEKELALHDYVVLNTEYDLDNYLKGTIPYDSYRAYGALVKGTAVCQGYAEAMYLLLNSVGIETNMVSGSGNGLSGWEGHAWNIVKINGDLYHLDATWDDPALDQEGRIFHSYFNVTDDKLSEDHRWDSKEYPECNGVKYNYDYYMYCIKNNVSMDKEPLKVCGIISLPAGEAAPKGGLEARVIIQTETGSAFGDKDYFSTNALVIIPEGSNSMTYSLEVPQINSGYSVHYNLLQDSSEYVSYGYYNNKGTVSNYYDKTLIGEANKSDVNLAIIKGNKVTGTIFLPNGEAAPEGGLKIWVTAKKSGGTPNDKKESFNKSISVTIPEGSNSIPYSIIVPPTASDYSVRYNLSEGSKDYLSIGYYSNEGTASNFGKKALIGIGNKSDVSLTILKGNRIGGTIFLPNGEVAPEGGLEIEVEAKTDNGTPEDNSDDFLVYTAVTIPKGSNSMPYSLLVPSSNSGYSVYYYISANYLIEKSLGYLTEGYYSNKGIVTDDDNATLVGIGSVSNVNLSIQKSGNK